MIYRTLGKTQYEVSSVALGCWNIGNQWGHISDEEVRNIVLTSYENGINLFDVADNYGEPNGMAEIRLGRYIHNIRNQIFLVSKVGHWGERSGQSVPYTTKDMIRLCGHASLGRLKTSYLDIILCHDGMIQDPTIYIEGFESLKNEGFVREYGISTDSLEVLKKFYEYSDGHCSVVEVEYSLVNTLPERNGLLDYCKEKNIGILVRSPLGQGAVSGKQTRDTVFTDLARQYYNIGGKYRKLFEKRMDIMDEIKRRFYGEDLIQLGLRYIISNKVMPVAIPGATSVQQAINNANAGKSLLDNELYAEVQNIVNQVVVDE